MLRRNLVNSEPMAPVNHHSRPDEQRQGFTIQGCLDSKQLVASSVESSAICLNGREMDLRIDNPIPPNECAPAPAISSIAAVDPCLIRSMVPPGCNRGAAGSPLNQVLPPLLILVTAAGAWTDCQPTPTNHVFTWERVMTCAIFFICLGVAGQQSCRANRGAGNAAPSIARRLCSKVSRKKSDSKNKKGNRTRTEKSAGSPPSDDESEGGGGGDPDDSDDDGSKRLMACPFFKLDPIRYHACGGYVLKNLYRVTQHMRRFHAQPESVCQICLKSFSNDDERDTHQALQGCVPPLGRDWLDNEELGKLRRVRGRNDWEKWYVIWDGLFGRHPRPDSPYINEGVARYDETLGRLAQRRYSGMLRDMLSNQGGISDNCSMPRDPTEFFSQFILPLIRPPYRDMAPIFRVPSTNLYPPSPSPQPDYIQYLSVPDPTSGPGSVYSTDFNYASSQPPYDEMQPGAIPLLQSDLGFLFNHDLGFPETENNNVNGEQMGPGYLHSMGLSDENQDQYTGPRFPGGQAGGEGSQRGSSNHGNGSYFL